MKKMTENKTVPNQTPVSWHIAFIVSWNSLRRRILRSLITLVGVVLGIAFLTYMLVNNNIIDALVTMKNDQLNRLLQRAEVDIFAESGSDPMMLFLIGLALFTCLVGIINAMLMSVVERIKEIGTLKCLGAENAFIVKTYFIESSLQAVLGTVLGVLVGFLGALTINLAYYGRYVGMAFPFFAVLTSMLWALAIGCIMSVTASIAPAYWAARKQPVEAMRVEE